MIYQMLKQIAWRRRSPLSLLAMITFSTDLFPIACVLAKHPQTPHTSTPGISPCIFFRPHFRVPPFVKSWWALDFLPVPQGTALGNQATGALPEDSVSAII